MWEKVKWIWEEHECLDILNREVETRDLVEADISLIHERATQVWKVW